MSSQQFKIELFDSDISYLAPPPEAHNIQHDDNYIVKINENEQPERRKIFYKVQYTPFELERIQEVEQELKQQNVQLYEGWDQGIALKFCYSGQFNCQKTVDLIKQHLSWYQNPAMKQLSALSLEFLRQGVCYQFGRDKQFRPVIYLNFWMIDLKQDLIKYVEAFSNLLYRISKYMFLKGIIENWIIIIDINNKGLLDMPIKAVGQILQMLALNFTCHLEKMYILNASWLAQQAWNLLKRVISQDTQTKINLLQKDQFHQMFQQIDPDQMEEKYGGTQPNITSFWPPQNTMKVNYNQSLTLIPDIVKQDSGNIQQKSKVMDSEYYSFQQNESNFFDFRNQNQQNYRKCDEKDTKFISFDQGDIVIDNQTSTSLDKPVDENHKSSCWASCSIFQIIKFF